MKLRFPVRLLVIDQSPTETDALVKALRKSNYVVKSVFANDLNAVQKELSETALDLVLIAHDQIEVPVTALLDILKANNIDAPVIVLDEYSHDPVGLEARDNALAAGVVDIVPRNEPLMLEHTVRRELSSQENRRRISRYQRHQNAEEQSLQWLVAHSRERLAITRGDEIIAANNGFLDLFGVENFDPPWRNGLLTCISPEERDELRALIEPGQDDETRALQIELQGTHQKQGHFDLLLDITNVIFQGETGLRVVASPLLKSSTQQSDEVTQNNGGATPHADLKTSTNKAKIKSPLEVVSNKLSNNEIEETAENPVLNREHFLSLISDACATQKSREGRVGIVYVDLDDYSSLKQEMGPVRVDVLIELVLQRLMTLAPDASSIARINDEDFALLINASDWKVIEEAYRTIETGICGAVLEVNGQSVLVSAGAGLTGLLNEDSDASAVLDRAFKASLSEIKSVVGVRAEPELEEEDDQESAYNALAQDLETAMQDGRLSLVFQPIVSLRGVPIELYEVFMRLQSKDGMMVPPREFLEAAANAGISGDLDLWLVQQAIDTLGEQHAQGSQTRLLVKVSDQAIGDVRVPLAVARGLRKYQLPGERLIIEIGERSAASQVKSTRTMLHALRGLNCATAIEHFGITRKPFRLLEHIPVDYLTVDASIVNRVREDKLAFERVKSIGTRARSLGKFSCAEYVEDAASVGLLYDAGIDFVQGFYIQSPLPTLDFEFSMMVG